MEKINADTTEPATMHGAALPWEPSPSPGVDRRRLERTGGERARVTSLVRYAPGSSFPEHTHGGGEEFLVLEGVFTDGSGDHLAGTWVRNGVGTAHAPSTAPGCVIFVKLWWMHPEESASGRVDTTDGGEWKPAPHGATLDLWRTEREHTRLVRLNPGAALMIDESRGAEAFVVEGDATLDGGALARWSWQRAPGAAAKALASGDGAVVYIKSGHLESPPEPP